MAHRLFLRYTPSLGLRLYSLIDRLKAAGCDVYCDTPQQRLAAIVPKALEGPALRALIAPYRDLIIDDGLEPVAQHPTLPEPYSEPFVRRPSGPHP